MEDAHIEVSGQLHEWVLSFGVWSVHWMSEMTGTSKTTIMYSLWANSELRLKLAASSVQTQLLMYPNAETFSDIYPHFHINTRTPFRYFEIHP
jgi:hypothetical protein